MQKFADEFNRLSKELSDLKFLVFNIPLNSDERINSIDTKILEVTDLEFKFKDLREKITRPDIWRKHQLLNQKVHSCFVDIRRIRQKLFERRDSFEKDEGMHGSQKSY